MARDNITAAPRLACPFYIFNRRKHASCRHLHLHRVADVKQHLDRCHRLPISCTTCWAPFSDEQSRARHVALGACQWTAQPDGISVEEFQSMMPLPRGNSTEERWQAIWEHLFPHAEPPSSPYIHPSHIEEAVEVLSPMVARALELPAIFIKNAMEHACQLYYESLPRARNNPEPHQQPQAIGGQAYLISPPPGVLHDGTDLVPQQYQFVGHGNELDAANGALPIQSQFNNLNGEPPFSYEDFLDFDSSFGGMDE